MAITQGKYENGSDIRIYASGKLVAGQQNCSIEMSSSTIDTSTKETGDYADYEVAGLEWSVSFDGLVPLTNDAYDILEDIWLAKGIVEIHIGRTGKYKKGNAVIESLSVNSAMKDKSKYSCSMKGCGAFSEVATEPTPAVLSAKSAK